LLLFSFARRSRDPLLLLSSSARRSRDLFVRPLRAIAACGAAAPAITVHPLLPLGILVPSSQFVSDLLFFSDLLICNMSANAIVVNIVLDGQNYPEWAFCVQTALKGHGLLFHLTEDSPVLAADRSNAAAIKTWQINDGKVMAAMVNNTKPTMIMSLSKFTTAKAIWSHLKDRFVQDSGALLHTLMQQTHVIEQHDMSIDEYYSAFDRLMCIDLHGARLYNCALSSP
jgi:hypothetical protein